MVGVDLVLAADYLVLWWYEGYTVYHHLIIGNGPDGPISLLHMALAIDIFILFLWCGQVTTGFAFVIKSVVMHRSL